MDKKDNLRELLLQAEAFLQLFKRLDYAAIAAHEPAAVAALKSAVRSIRGGRPGGADEALPNYEQLQQAVASVAEDKNLIAERRRAFVEVLSQAGLSARLGKVYSTQAESRLAPFREVPHKQGLPQFDMVVAADYSPQSGYHGIFVDTHEVMSWILPTPYDRPWQPLARHRFATLEQMGELVGLLAAGFPVS